MVKTLNEVLDLKDDLESSSNDTVAEQTESSTSTTDLDDPQETIIKKSEVVLLVKSTSAEPSPQETEKMGRRSKASEQTLVTHSSDSIGSRGYKFGLNNHFITMPDVKEQQDMKQLGTYNPATGDKLEEVARNGVSIGRDSQQGEVKVATVSAKTKESVGKYLESIRLAASTESSKEHAEGEHGAEDDDRCDLSVLVPSSAGALSSLSSLESCEPLKTFHHQEGHYQGRHPDRHDQPSDHNHSYTHQATLVTSSRHLVRGAPQLSPAHHHSRRHNMVNRTTKSRLPDSPITKRESLLPTSGSFYHDRMQGHSSVGGQQRLLDTVDESRYPFMTANGNQYMGDNLVLSRQTGATSASGRAANNANSELHWIEAKKQKELLAGGHDEDCASNSVLIKFSSIMYATFLVVLGCILHCSELRQQSKNSSDHIYTIVVALVGIIWLLFLQIDLQRYKKYASKFILIESIFSDQIKLQRQQQFKPHQDHPDGRPVFMGSGSVDPTARSTSSSSASLVNLDRLSMSTEMIFKKTAYKIFEEQQKHKLQLASGNHHQSYNQNFGDNHSHQIITSELSPRQRKRCLKNGAAGLRGHPNNLMRPAYKFLHGKMGANFYLKCGMAAFCFGSVIHEGLRFGQQLYFFATSNENCRDFAALMAHLVTPLYSFYQLFMMFKYSNLVINRHKILARFGLMHIIGTCVTFWIRTILEEAFEDFVHKMDYFKTQSKPVNLDASSMFTNRALLAAPTNADQQTSLANLLLGSLWPSETSVPFSLTNATTTVAPHGQPQQTDASLAHSALLALMSSPISATISPQLARHLPDSYACAQNTLLTTKSMNALPYLYPFTIEYNLLIAATFLSLYFNIGKVGHLSGGCSLPGQNNVGQSGVGSPMQAQRRLGTKVASKRHRTSSSGSSSSSSGASVINKRPDKATGWPSEASFVSGDQQSGAGSEHSSTAPVLGQPARFDALRFISGREPRPLADSAMGAGPRRREHEHEHEHEHELDKNPMGEYKSNFVVNADCHSANKGLFCGFFVLLVTLVTIVIFFVTINKPSHVQLGIKINLIQEVTLSSLILVVTLAAFRQIVRLNRSASLKDKISTDDVLMLIPLPFFFIHSLLSFRAETAALYSSTSMLSGPAPPQSAQAPPTSTGGRSPATGPPASSSSTGASSGDSANNPTTLAHQRSAQERGSDDGRLTNGPAELVQSRLNQLLLSLPSGQVPTRSWAHNGTNTNTGRQTVSGNEQRGTSRDQTQTTADKVDPFKLVTVALNLGVMVEVLVQTNFIIDGLRRCSDSRYLRFKKPGRELITFAILLNITYWIVATFETKSVEQYKTGIEYYGPLPYMFISHTTLPVMLFYRYHSSVCLAEIWNRAYKPSKR